MIKAMLADYRRRVLESRTRASLEAIAAAAQAPLTLAADMLDQIGRERSAPARSVVPGPAQLRGRAPLGRAPSAALAPAPREPLFVHVLVLSCGHPLVAETDEPANFVEHVSRPCFACGDQRRIPAVLVRSYPAARFRALTEAQREALTRRTVSAAAKVGAQARGTAPSQARPYVSAPT